MSTGLARALKQTEAGSNPSCVPVNCVTWGKLLALLEAEILTYKMGIILRTF